MEVRFLSPAPLYDILFGMPDLPTVTVTTEQQTRILAALKQKFGTNTNAETVLEYRRWLIRRLREIVFEAESEGIAQQASSQMANLDQDINGSLTDPT